MCNMVGGTKFPPNPFPGERCMRYVISVKISSERTLNFNVGGYSNNEKRIRFKDERTGLLKNFPEEWCSIEEVRE